ncbi:unnamed protein product, partial [Mesorhabditis belari]|uniref:Death-associated protein 1 n=1 Tax=Mesorhabditis belari TaxID=2138241 RepID=A0AAF3F3P4_9BILA
MSDQELKAGHLPAQKAGGMRVPTRKARTPSETENKTPSSESSEEKVEEVKLTDNILCGTGLASQTNKDYPPEAIQKYHNKPVPQHPNKQIHANAPNHQTNMPVFQPQRGN